MGWSFDLGQFLWMEFAFVVVPVAIGVAVHALGSRAERRDPETSPENPRRLGLLSTGLLASLLGFVCCAGWLTWSADARGEVLGPGLPPPSDFPQWQVLASAATTILAWWLAARVSRLVFSGGYAAALGIAAGFSTAFAIPASTDITGLSGVGIVMCVFGIGLGLTLLAGIRGALVRATRSRRPR